MEHSIHTGHARKHTFQPPLPNDNVKRSRECGELNGMNLNTLPASLWISFVGGSTATTTLTATPAAASLVRSYRLAFPMD